MNEEPLPPPQFDKQVLDLLYDAVGESMVNIIILFLENFPQQIAQMQQALQKNDLDTVARLAHSLKSSCASLGAMQLATVARDLEQMISGGEKNKEVIANSIDKLQACFDQVHNIYAEYL